MVDVVNVTKRFGSFTAISGIELHIDRASAYGLVGYNGAGKTTLLKTMSGVYRPEEGEVRLLGERVYDNPEMKQRMFYVPDELYFAPFSTMNKMARFYRGYYPKFSTKTFSNLTEVFGLDPDKRIASFSKGMQRQAEMALAMATHPDVLMLDESFDGLDPAKRNMVGRLMLEYMAEKECVIIISSHNLHELADLCDHIALINGQKIVMDCSVDETSGSRSKFRVIFDRDVGENDFANIPGIKSFKKDGKIITFTAESNDGATEALIKKLNPIMSEEITLSLEEIFLEEMEGKEYDLSKIFD